MSCETQHFNLSIYSIHNFASSQFWLFLAFFWELLPPAVCAAPTGDCCSCSATGHAGSLPFTNLSQHPFAQRTPARGDKLGSHGEAPYLLFSPFDSTWELASCDGRGKPVHALAGHVHRP